MFIINILKSDVIEHGTVEFINELLKINDQE